MKLLGKGLILDITTGAPFGDYGELLIRFGVETINIPRGDTTGSYTIPVGTQATGRISWYDISPKHLASLIGGEHSPGSVRKKDHEAHTVPEDTLMITLVHSEVITNSEVVLAKSSERFERVSENPLKNEYTITDNELTFNEQNAGQEVFITYFHYDEAEGIQIDCSPWTLPSYFELLGSLRLLKTGIGMEAGDIVINAKRCIRISPLEVGALSGEAGRLGFDFAIENIAPGDLTIYFSE